MTRKPGITDQMIVEKYKNGERVIKLAEFAGISPRAIRNVLYKNGYDKLKQPRKYNVNENFFKKWTNEMAYVLGFILTDGCVYQNKEKYNTNFNIAQKDKNILMKIAKVLESEHPIRRIEKTGVYVLTIPSQEMVADLIALGITANKSKTVGFPEVPEQYLSHFVRGVIDGDGSVDKCGYLVTVTSASSEFSIGLNTAFKNRGLNTKIRIEMINTTNIYRIVISGRADVLNLADWLYEDCGILLLERKRMRFYDDRSYSEKVKEGTTRVSFRPYIDKNILNKLRDEAKSKNTRSNYLLELGIKRMMQDQINIKVMKSKYKKDRVRYSTKVDKELLLQLRAFAKDNNLYLNDIVEYSTRYIN